MAVGETAKLIASLELKDKFSPGVAKVTKSLAGLDSRIDRSSSKATQFGQHLGIGIQNGAKIAAIGIGLLTTQVALGLNSLVKLEKAQAQTAAVIKSTGGAAGVTAEQVGQLAEKYESLNATVGDEVIRSAENLLLTFTGVRKKAFEPALAAILDMNTALGKGPEGLNTTVTAVGKALNDPTKGITALRKAGVVFTESQLKQIKALQKSGDLLGAQKIVIAELNKEFGGSFIAEGGTTGGKVAKFADAIEDLQRTLAEGLLPVVGNIADALSDLFADPQIQDGVRSFGQDLAKVLSPANIKQGIADIRSLAGVIAPAFQVAATAIGKVIEAFSKLPPDLRNLLVGAFAVNKLTGGLVSNIAGGLASAIGGALKTIVAANVTVIGKNVTGGGLPGVPAAGAAAGGIGAGALIAGTAGAFAIVAVQEASKEAAKGFNAEFRKVGIIADFKGALAGPQGILPGIQNLAEAVRVFGELNKPKPTPGPANVAGFTSGDQGPRTDPKKREWRTQDFNKVVTAVEGVRAGVGADLSNHKTQTRSAIIESGLAAKNSTMEVKAQVASAAMIQQALLLSGMATTRMTAASTQGAIRGVAPPIVGALRNLPRPITNVTVNVSATHVTKSTTVQNRYGPGNGSSGQDARPGDSGV